MMEPDSTRVPQSYAEARAWLMVGLFILAMGLATVVTGLVWTVSHVLL